MGCQKVHQLEVSGVWELHLPLNRQPAHWLIQPCIETIRRRLTLFSPCSLSRCKTSSYEADDRELIQAILITESLILYIGAAHQTEGKHKSSYYNCFNKIFKKHQSSHNYSTKMFKEIQPNMHILPWFMRLWSNVGCCPVTVNGKHTVKNFVESRQAGKACII